MARRSCTVGATGPTSTPCSTEAVTAGSVVSGARRASRRSWRERDRTGQRAQPAEQGRGVVHREQEGREGQRRRRDGPLEDRHLQHQPLHPVGVVGGHEQRRVGTQRGAHQDGALDAQVIEQSHDLLGVHVDAVLRSVCRSVAATVSEEVQRHDPEAGRRKAPSGAPVGPRVEEQAVEHHDEPIPGPHLLVGDRPRPPAERTLLGCSRCRASLGSHPLHLLCAVTSMVAGTGVARKRRRSSRPAGPSSPGRPTNGPGRRRPGVRVRTPHPPLGE